MYIHNDLHLKLYAEDYIRARLQEVENFRMLNQLRKHHQNKYLRPFLRLLGRLGRTLIVLGWRLESIGFSSSSLGENGWAGLSMSN